MAAARPRATCPLPYVPSTSRLMLATEGVFESLSAAARTPSPFVRRLCLHCSVLGMGPQLSGELNEVRDELERQIERYRETTLLAGHIGGEGTPPARKERHKAT